MAHSDSFICTYRWIGIWRTALFQIGNFKFQRLLDFIFLNALTEHLNNRYQFCMFWCINLMPISLYRSSHRTAKFCKNESQHRKGVGVGHSAEIFSNWDSFWFPFQPLLSSWCDLWVSSAIVSLVTARHYVLRQRIQVLYAFKSISKKTSKLTVTSKLRSSEGDWKLERKDCPTCPACPSVHPCLRPSLPGGSITNLSHVSERFLDFCYFAGSLK